ncbi:sn-glycerol-3-phosphate ABC transporter ATP-binding protein UgpC [Oharaeibacter diazotrophicus]|uniref:Carbohydrate ABC transporter ATP-binding protein (CUT1 family) n=1 Tax=Oharaeibacter diazotrophicus TaxID=1920512 RepID=A0A4R6RIG2_9HYPH|nr:sn-glycerol-3-phosphate ABC transporter ATP-binding protein UgpC [Oharaeibacter diazotrophicus]TDP85446.1 carbohydrate ABC transporter ATP-binding protein (CUT1 family) [Oharaeibacter diazotrophicus]BBE74416.1 sn-glycerol-3-phosphate import ATP-binding protein UgpC [Pleomorphomonas sp. SM30]GLS75888.1 sn-glycerol-3-phosphate import ATP-binding protein UgpC 2 [Oharaeibacter diazotrophicus]
MAEIRLSAVRKSYGRVEVVRGVDLDVAAGEFLVILGPSGCGKSTLLRMIAGLETITAGEIAIAGDVVNRKEPRERGCAMVFQNYALYPHMTVADNIGYALKVAGVKRAERQARVAAVADALGLGEFLARKPGQLSGGQRQRVAMGRAMIRQPRVFLYDEPLSNLDARLRVAMRMEIRRLHQRLGTTSLFVTHDQVEAMTLADRIVVMNKGVVEQVGTPTEVYGRPASTYVAAFVGSPGLNLLHGVADPAAGVIRLDGGPVLAYRRERWPDVAAGPVTAGFRAEDAAPADGVGVPFAVDFVEELGAGRHAHGHIAGQPAIVHVGPGRPVAPRTQMALTIPADAVQLFAAEDGRRLREVAPVAVPELA